MDLSQQLKERAKSVINQLAGAYIKKIKIIAIVVISLFVALLLIVSMGGGGGKDYASSDTNTEGMSTVSTETQAIQYLHAKEGGGTIYKNEDGVDCYKVASDGSANGLAVGYGVDIGVHGSELSALGYDTSKDSLIPVNIVDSIENKTITDYCNQIKSQANAAGVSLTQYQLDALTSRAYNCGVAGAVTYKRGSKNLNFWDTYKQYWNQSTDDKFSSKIKEGDYEHSLYKEYMKEPTTSNGEYLAGLENRRKSEWTLFQTGYYDALGVWYNG